MSGLALSVPILDWGRSESQVKLAESQRELVVYDVEQDRQDFERRVVVQVEQFNLIRSQIATAEAADKVAEEGYTDCPEEIPERGNQHHRSEYLPAGKGRCQTGLHPFHRELLGILFSARGR